MSGNITSLGHGVWNVRVSVGFDPVTGRRRRVNRTVHGSRRDAQTVLNKLVFEADEGAYDGTNATFRELAERWLKTGTEGRSPRTLSSYRGYLRLYIYPLLGEKPVKKINTIDLDRLYRGLEEQRGLSPGSVRKVHSIIHRAFRQGEIWGWASSNPAALATQPRVKRSRITPPSVEEMTKLIKAADELDPEFGRFLFVAMTTAARRGELCGYKWSDLDVKSKTLSIERAIIGSEGGGYQEKDTKTSKGRRLKLDDETLDVLKTQRGFLDERASVASIKVGDDAFIFSLEVDGSTPFLPDYASHRFAVVRKYAGVKTRLHDVRHFAASQMIGAGYDVRTVSDRLGHSNPNTTLSTYAHAIEARGQAAADFLGGLTPKPGVAATRALRSGAVAKKSPAAKKSSAPVTKAKPKPSTGARRKPSR